jgi:hypothetical protein
MPGNISGIGTIYYGHGAAVNWNKPSLRDLINKPDHDAVNCVIFFFLPLFPLKAYHTFNWSGNTCLIHPIRRSSVLLLRAMLRPYLMGIFAVSILALMALAAILIFGTQNKKILENIVLFWLIFVAVAFTFVLSLALSIWLNKCNKHSRDIRLLLGPHELGSSDPATWPEEILEKFESEITYLRGDKIQLAKTALREGKFSEAMLAARFALGKGDKLGEQVTDLLLHDTRVRDALDEIRKKPWRRFDILKDTPLYSFDPRVARGEENPVCYIDGKELDVYAGSRASSAQTGARFYDGRYYCNDCLEQAGGPGCADAVRAEPELVRRVPHPWWMSMFLLMLICLFLAAGIDGLLNEKDFDKDAGAFLGFLLLVGISGFFFINGRLRRVRLGNGRLAVGVTNRNAPLDSIIEIRHRLFAFILPVVSVSILLINETYEITWPRSTGASEDIEKAIRTAMRLREMQGAYISKL